MDTHEKKATSEKVAFKACGIRRPCSNQNSGHADQPRRASGVVMDSLSGRPARSYLSALMIISPETSSQDAKMIQMNQMCA
ncbi:MAG: hypothetical protein C0487_09225 [Leptothrix sp. (in: Bacteria)]|nr:hypothetical protein [Leptothrix sp. (in: b-proteobacteria)]